MDQSKPDRFGPVRSGSILSFFSVRSDPPIYRTDYFSSVWSYANRSGQSDRAHPQLYGVLGQTNSICVITFNGNVAKTNSKVLKLLLNVKSLSATTSDHRIFGFCDAPKPRLKDYTSGNRLATESYATTGIKYKNHNSYKRRFRTESYFSEKFGMWSLFVQQNQNLPIYKINPSIVNTPHL